MMHFFYAAILFMATLFSPASFLQAKQTSFGFTFATGNEGWVGDFADYPVGEENFYELEWGWASLPNPTPPILTQAMFLSGNNHSDDLFMFIKKRIGGLKPKTKYRLFFNVIIQNNIAPGQFGVGGSPGESVYFKVGASTVEPKKVVTASDFYQLNVDKGDQSMGGKNAIVIGNLANPLVNINNPQFEFKQMASSEPLKVRTDKYGCLWIFVGTDSAFEGSTLYYISAIDAIFER